NGKPGDDAGWVKLFEDGLGATYGDWRAPGVSYTWQARYGWGSTPEARARIQEQQRQRALQDAERQLAAAARAARIWSRAHWADHHAYTDRKRVQLYGLKVQFGHAAEMRGQFWVTNRHGEPEQLTGLLLLIPMRD